MTTKSHISASDYYDPETDGSESSRVVWSHKVLPNVVEVSIRFDDGDNSGIIDTGVTLPDKCFIGSSFLVNDTGEAATIDVGVTGAVSAIMDDFDTTTTDAIIPSDVALVDGSGKNVIYQASVNFSSYIGRVFLTIWNLTEV